MANKSNIKGISVNIGGDTTELDKALKGVNKQCTDLQSELTAVNRALKFDPSNTKLLAQKYDLLNNSITSTAQKLNTLKETESQIEAQFKSGSIGVEQFRAFQREIETTKSKLSSLQSQKDNIKQVGDKFVDASQQAKIFEKSIENVKNETSKLNSQISSSVDGLASGLKKASVAAIAAGTAIFSLTAKSATAADDINTLSKVTGLSTDEIQKFSYASDIIDVSLDTLTGSMAKLIKNMAKAKEGTGTASEAFDALGISVTNSKGELLNNQDVFNSTITALGKIENETQRDAYAMSIFGKSAQELNPLILGGADALTQLSNSAEKSGMILSQDALDGLNKFQDSMDLLKADATSTGMVVATQFTESFQSVFDTADSLFAMVQKAKEDGTLAEIANEVAIAVKNVITVLTSAVKFVWEYRNAILAGATALVAFKAALTISEIIVVAVNAYKSLKVALETATVAQSVLNATMKTNPIVLCVSAVLALATGLGVLALTTDNAGNSLKDYNSEMDSAKKNAEDIISNSESESSALQQKADLYEKLRTKVNRTSAEEATLKQVALDLQSVLPEGTKLINEQTGAYNALGTSIDNVIAKSKAQAKFDAATAQYKAAIAAQKGLEDSVTKIKNTLAENKKNPPIISFTTDSDLTKAKKALEDNKKIQDDYAKDVADFYNTMAEINASNDNTSPMSYMEQTEKSKAQKAVGVINDDTEKISDAFKSRQDEIERAYNRKDISETEYYDKTEENLKISNAYGIAAYNEYYDKIYVGRKELNEKLKSEQDKSNKERLDSEEKINNEILANQKETSKEAVNTVKEQIKAISDESKSQYDEVIKQRESLQSKLDGYGDLFTTKTDDSGKKSIELGNINTQISAIQKYNDSLSMLKSKGASENFMSNILNMDVDEANGFMDKLNSLSDTEFNAYIESWNNKQKLSNDIATKYYQTQLDSINTNFVSKINEIFANIPTQISGIGTNTITGFINGLNMGQPDVITATTDVCNGVLDTFVETLDIHSPSKKTEEIGEFVVEGFIQGLIAKDADLYNALHTAFVGNLDKVFGEMQQSITDNVSKISAGMYSLPVANISKVSVPSASKAQSQVSQAQTQQVTQPVTINYTAGNITIQGNADDTTIEKMKQIADNAVGKFARDIVTLLPLSTAQVNGRK